MPNLLRIIVEGYELAHTVTNLQIDIDFVPSLGLVVHHPIACTIGYCTYTKDGYIAIADKVFIETEADAHPLQWYLDNGWTEFKPETNE